jgi:hypothetical protein
MNLNSDSEDMEVSLNAASSNSDEMDNDSENDSEILRRTMLFSTYPSSSLPPTLLYAPYKPGVTPATSLVHILFKFVRVSK